MPATAPPATAFALPFAPACPRCRSALDINGDAAHCARCAETYRCEGGIWRFLPAERAARFASFLAQYETVRAAEGWGRPDPAYYAALPRVPADDPQRAIWRLRSRHYRALIARVVCPLERARGRPLAVLDLGAGNCWLAHRLARRGHRVAAVDLSTDRLDGLGARAWYGDFAPFAAVQADYEHLPCEAGQFDLAIFNASLHYAADCTAALGEALRALRADGRLAVLDTPVYRDPTSGARMVRERASRFAREHSFTDDALPCEGYLTPDRLRGLAATLDLRWTTAGPHDPRPALHTALARLRGRREPARFPALVGRRQGGRRLKSRLYGLRATKSACADWGESAEAGFAASRDEPPAAVATAGAPTAGATAGAAVAAGSLQNWGVGGGRSPALRALWRAGLRWRYRLFQRHRYDRLALEHVAGLPIVVLPGVFNPKLLRTGEFLVQSLNDGLLPLGARVLDLGTGSGVGAVAAARRGAAQVVATDINPTAARCARLNALLNNVAGRVAVRAGDLFAPVGGERFDVVLFNPPYYRGEPRDDLDRAWRSPDVIERFAAGLGDHLAPDGRALVVLSTDGEAPAFLRACAARGLAIDAVARRDLVNEVLTVYRLKSGVGSRQSAVPASPLLTGCSTGAVTPDSRLPTADSPEGPC